VIYVIVNAAAAAVVGWLTVSGDETTQMVGAGALAFGYVIWTVLAVIEGRKP